MAAIVSGGAVWWTLTRWMQVWCVCSVKTVWSIPERFRGELLMMGRYTNLCTFTFIFTLLATPLLKVLSCLLSPVWQNRPLSTIRSWDLPTADFKLEDRQLRKACCLSSQWHKYCSVDAATQGQMVQGLHLPLGEKYCSTTTIPAGSAVCCRDQNNNR